MSASASPQLTGVGLITGQPCRTGLAGSAHPGIHFVWPDGDSVTANVAAVAASERGVTLLGPNGKTLSIVEHFLAACALVNVNQLTVYVDGPELPILDGSAYPWLALLAPFGQHNTESTEKLPTTIPSAELPLIELALNTPLIIHADNSDSWIKAEAADRFGISYTVDFNHDALPKTTMVWSPHSVNAMDIARAGTFGRVSELPAMQAKGFALGVTEANTLGLTDEGGLTRPLRMPHEPVAHKILDCLGDLMLTGVNPLLCPMHITAYKAGHTTHLALAKALLPYFHHQT
jgi:UDP-3-O-[3-hydroxymyristoyl] N-acetylglucosamine deacetylase